MRKRSIIWTYSKEQVQKWVDCSSTFGEVLNKLGLVNKGSNFKTLQRFLDINDIKYADLLHRRNQKRIEGMHRSTHRPLQDILVKGSKCRSSSLRERLIRENLLRNECYECGLPPLWNNKKLVLQLDHKNGDNTDNRLENLRILCPNCHTQTPTFCGKNPLLERKFCENCNVLLAVYTKGNQCTKCFDTKDHMRRIRKLLPSKVENRPSKEELEKLIAQKSWTAIGEDYGVSDNAVRKWAIGYGMVWAKRPYKRKNQEAISQILQD